MKLEYKKVDVEDVDFLNQRNEVFKKLENNIIPNKKELELIMAFERKYRLCGGCKKSVSDSNFMVSIATAEVKGKTIKVGYFEKCFACEMKSDLFGF
jgi:hypothetical protein